MAITSILNNTAGEIKHGQSRETVNVRQKTKTNEAKTEYALDTSMRKQTQIT